MFLEVFFESLAVDEPTIEHEYVSLLLSVDGLQHPLLRELTSFHELNQPRCNISSAEFSTLRFPVLKGTRGIIDIALLYSRGRQVVFTSLNNALERQNGAGSDQDVQKYIDYCIKCFSTIRSIFSVSPYDPLERMDELDENYSVSKEVLALALHISNGANRSLHHCRALDIYSLIKRWLICSTGDVHWKCFLEVLFSFCTLQVNVTIIITTNLGIVNC